MSSALSLCTFPGPTEYAPVVPEDLNSDGIERGKEDSEGVQYERRWVSSNVKVKVVCGHASSKVEDESGVWTCEH